MEILILSILIAVVAGVTFLAKLTLERLSTKIEPYYMFDLNLDASGKWSVVFFLIIISILTLVVLASSQATFPLRPA